MAYFTKSAGNSLRASQVNALLKQGIPAFADATARDAAIASPDDGQRAHLTGSDTLTVYTGSAWEIEAEPPQSWSPTITQGSAVAGTVQRGWYQRSRGVFHAHLTWVASAGGTSTNGIIISSPLTLADAEDIGGAISYRDIDVPNWRVGVAIPDTTAQFRFIIDEGAAEYGVAAGDTIASGHAIRCDITGRY